MPRSANCLSDALSCSDPCSLIRKSPGRVDRGFRTSGGGGLWGAGEPPALRPDVAHSARSRNCRRSSLTWSLRSYRTNRERMQEPAMAEDPDRLLGWSVEDHLAFERYLKHPSGGCGGC
jgi:hypothetical protein